jgi:STE24 endopeptidase
MLVLVPLFIAPMFNKFKPLEDEALRTRIENLMAAHWLFHPADCS